MAQFFPNLTLHQWELMLENMLSATEKGNNPENAKKAVSYFTKNTDWLK